MSVVERDVLRKAGCLDGDNIKCLTSEGVAFNAGLPLGATSTSRSTVNFSSIEGIGGAGVCLLSRLPENRPLILSKTYLLLERALGV